MRMLAAALAALMLAAVPAAAESGQPKSKQDAKKIAPQSASQAQPRPGNGYVEQLADKMRFGSTAWWEQMRREGRLGGETP